MESKTQTLTYRLQNVKCSGCQFSILDKIKKLPLVEDAKFEELSALEITVSDTESEQLLLDALNHMGYPRENDPNGISKKAKSFVSCAIGRVNSKMS